MKFTNNYTVPALNRAIDVLEILATSDGEVSLHELSSKTGIPKSTLFRILFTLEKRKFIEQDYERKKFGLGMKLWELGNIKIEKSELSATAVKYMKRLSDKVNENVFLGVLDQSEVIYLQKVESTARVKTVTKLGRRAPAYCTATGQAIIAFLPKDEIDRLFPHQDLPRYSKNTITTKEKLLKKLDTIKADGYAIADGEFNPELLCISVPVRDFSKEVVAALTIDMLTSRGNIQKLKDIITPLRETASVISMELGYNF